MTSNEFIERLPIEEALGGNVDLSIYPWDLLEVFPQVNIIC